MARLARVGMPHRVHPWLAQAVILLAIGCSGTTGGGGGTTDGGGAVSRPARDGGGPVEMPTAEPSPSATAPSSGVCVPPLARCDGGLACCQGSLCVDQGDAKRCVQTCNTRFDCGSLCCLTDPATKQKLCASSDLCPPLECSDIGGSCSQPGPTCCSGLTCVSSSSPDYAGCRKPCKTASDCDTGCCVPYADGTPGFCGASSLCGCAAMDETCGGTAHCCSGLVCTTFDGTGAYACRPSCRSSGDCAAACCVRITGTSDSACLDPTFCGKKSP